MFASTSPFALKFCILLALAIGVALLGGLAAERNAAEASIDIREVRKLLASDPANGDLFGGDVAISGDTVVIGARGFNNETGAAYVFQRNQSSPDDWDEIKKLTASDASLNDLFGWRVSISGDTVVIGAHDAGGGGAAYVFERDQGGLDNWGEVAKLTGSDTAVGDEFGSAVAVSGDAAIVGAPIESEAGFEAGAAYVFHRDEGGLNNWGEVQKLTASDAGASEGFGWSTAMDGEIALVGAPFESEEAFLAGASYAFGRDEGGTDNWGEVTKITASDAGFSDSFGWRVALSGGSGLVGTTSENAVYVVDEDEGGASNWGEVAKISGVSPTAAISGSSAVVDSGETARIHERDAGGADNWGAVKTFVASDGAGGDSFGSGFGLSGETLVVGAPGNDEAGSQAGAAYVFDPAVGGVAELAGVDASAATTKASDSGLPMGLIAAVAAAAAALACGAAMLVRRQRAP